MQVAVIFAVAAFWMLRNWHTALAALLGGAAVVIANVYFLYSLFSSRKRTAAQIIRAFYIGEILKLVISWVLLLLIFELMGVKLIPLLSGFIAAYMAVWFMPFFMRI